MRKIIKIFICILIIFELLNIFNEVLAYVDRGLSPEDYKPNQITEMAYAFSKASIVLGFIRNISIVVSVIVLMTIGVKYIIGSVEEKANYKQTMVPYVIGCIMAVSGTTLVAFIYNAFNG